MSDEKRLIDAVRFRDVLDRYLNAPHVKMFNTYSQGMMLAIDTCIQLLDIQPAVDSVVMPKGKPGDYLEWDNGTGFKQIYHIHSVMICEDCMRYELANFTPVVNHPNIVRILSKEEAEREWKERCARERAEEEPTLTACAEKMDGGAANEID